MAPPDERGQKSGVFEVAVYGPLMLLDFAAPMQCFDVSWTVEAQKYIMKLPSASWLTSGAQAVGVGVLVVVDEGGVGKTYCWTRLRRPKKGGLVVRRRDFRRMWIRSRC